MFILCSERCLSITGVCYCQHKKDLTEPYIFVAVAVATRLSIKAMNTLSVKAFVVFCFQTFKSSAFPCMDAAILARLDVMDRQMASPRARRNCVLRETDIEVPVKITWSAQSCSDDGVGEAVKMHSSVVNISLAMETALNVLFEDNTLCRSILHLCSHTMRTSGIQAGSRC